MRSRFCLLSFAACALTLVLTACTPPTLEQRFVDEVAEALGGRARIAQLRTVALVGEGTSYNLGQDLRPEAAGQSFAVANYTRRLDLVANRARVEQTRTPHFTYFQGPDPQRQIFGIDADLVYTVNAAGAASRVTGQGAVDRRIDAFGHPLAIMRAALSPGAAIANVRTEGAERMADITTGTGLTFILAVDATGLPVRASVNTRHFNLGDVTVSMAFADYQDVNGLKLPRRITTKVDDFVTAKLRVRQQAVDSDLGGLSAPALPLAPAAPPAPVVTVEPVGRGLWLLAGQSHHSALVEFADHLVLIEAPQSEARTLAVIARARETVPAKPLTMLVTTHHHFDHTAGLRAAIAEGLTVVTQAGNRAFVETMAERPHTRQPDLLQRAPKTLRVETVDDQRELKDAAMAMTLYHVPDNPHSETMLMAYFPALRVLVEVDAFSPGSASHPFAANLLENIKKRNLRVDRIVPLHGTIVPFSQLVSAAK